MLAQATFFRKPNKIQLLIVVKMGERVLHSNATGAIAILDERIAI